MSTNCSLAITEVKIRVRDTGKRFKATYHVNLIATTKETNIGVLNVCAGNERKRHGSCGGERGAESNAPGNGISRHADMLVADRRRGRRASGRKGWASDERHGFKKGGGG